LLLDRRNRVLNLFQLCGELGVKRLDALKALFLLCSEIEHAEGAADVRNQLQPSLDSKIALLSAFQTIICHYTFLRT